MITQPTKITAPLHLIGAFVRGDKDVALPIDIVQEVGASQVNIMSQAAVSKAISEGIVFESYNREQIDQKDQETLDTAIAQHTKDLEKYDKEIKIYIREEDVKYFDELRDYAHSQDLFYSDKTLTEANAYCDVAISKISLLNVKGRVDTVDDLPYGNNLTGDIWLVGPVGAEDFEEWYWLTTEGNPRWEKLGSVKVDVDLSNYYNKTEINALITPITNDVSMLKTSKVDKVTGKQLSTEDFTTEYKTRLSSFTQDDINTMLSVNSNENERISNETVRQAAETERQINSAQAITNVNNKLNEVDSALTDVETAISGVDSAISTTITVRNSTEQLRQEVAAAEETRVISEANRSSNEDIRKANEETRQAQELIREANVEQAITDANAASLYAMQNGRGAFNAAKNQPIIKEGTWWTYNFSDDIYANTEVPAIGEAGKSPKIENNTWWVYNNTTGAYEDTGVSANGLKGDKGDPGDPGDNGAEGLPGKSPIIQSDTWWIWNTETSQYEDTNISVSSAYELTKSKIENVFTGDITSHTHNSMYYTKEEIDAKIGYYILNVDSPSDTVYTDVETAIADMTHIAISSVSDIYNPVDSLQKVGSDYKLFAFRGNVMITVTVKPNNTVSTTYITLVSEEQIIDNLTSTNAKQILSANQGRILNDKISGLGGSFTLTVFADKTTAPGAATELMNAYDASKEIYVVFESDNAALYKPVKYEKLRDIDGFDKLYLYLIKGKTTGSSVIVRLTLNFIDTNVRVDESNFVTPIDELTSVSTIEALSANQGRVLDSKLDYSMVKNISALTRSANSIFIPYSTWNLKKAAQNNWSIEIPEATVAFSGLLNAADKTKLSKLQVGENGVAQLDATGKVPASQLPSYVDDVLDGHYIDDTTFNDLEGTAYSPESGKIYVDVDTNKTYRWSGTIYAPIGADIALGETSATAYPGDKGKLNADNIVELSTTITNIEAKIENVPSGPIDSINVYCNNKKIIYSSFTCDPGTHTKLDSYKNSNYRNSETNIEVKFIYRAEGLEDELLSSARIGAIITNRWNTNLFLTVYDVSTTYHFDIYSSDRIYFSPNTNATVTYIPSVHYLDESIKYIDDTSSKADLLQVFPTKEEFHYLYMQSRNTLFCTRDWNNRVVINPVEPIIGRGEYQMIIEVSMGTSHNRFYLGATLSDYENTLNAFSSSSKDFVGFENVLSLGRESEFTPTGDYNPATKKYVDDTSLQTTQLYVDKIIKTYEDINLYFTTTGISTNKPTGAGTQYSLEVRMNEQMWFTRSYTIPSEGVIDKDNLYKVFMSFSGLTKQRDVYIRIKWVVDNVEIINKICMLNNSAATFDFSTDVVNRLINDMPYSAGSIAVFTLSAWCSQQYQTMNVLLGDVDKPAGIVRSAPVATLSSTKIIDDNGTDIKSVRERLEDLSNYAPSALLIPHAIAEIPGLSTPPTSAEILTRLGGSEELFYKIIEYILDANKAESIQVSVNDPLGNRLGTSSLIHAEANKTAGQAHYFSITYSVGIDLLYRLTITKNTNGTFQSSNQKQNTPTQTSQLINNSGYVTLDKVTNDFSKKPIEIPYLIWDSYEEQSSYSIASIFPETLFMECVNGAGIKYFITSNDLQEAPGYIQVQSLGETDEYIENIILFRTSNLGRYVVDIAWKKGKPYEDGVVILSRSLKLNASMYDLEQAIGNINNVLDNINGEIV